MALVEEIKVLEILKRAKGFQSGEGVSAFESESNVREEAIRRSTKAGITHSDGTPAARKDTGAGKGDNPRPINKRKYDENYIKIFGHK